MVSKVAVLFFVLLASSCTFLPKKTTPANCGEFDFELYRRRVLFKKLSDEEIERRQAIALENFSAFAEFSVFSEIINSIKSSPHGAKLIPVDLRHYKKVPLGNIVISNISGGIAFDLFLETSKFSQGFFALINFGKDEVVILPPKDFPASTKSPFFEKNIQRDDLQDVELVLNVSQAGEVFGNMKFSQNQKVSIIADNVKKPYRLDLREATNMQFNLNQKWIMSLYSIEGSALEGGKDTTGLFKFVNNRNVRSINLDKFSKSDVQCYSDEAGERF